MDFESRAKEVLEKILEEFKKKSKWDKRSLSQMIEEYLSEFNEYAREKIEEAIYKELNDMYFPFASSGLVADSVVLSEMLYKNSSELSKEVNKILRDSLKVNATAKEIAMKIYDGFDKDKNEVIKVFDELPKYIRDYLKQPRKPKEIMKQFERLKTKPLRVAYKEIVRSLEKMNYEALDRALMVAKKEKMRYYANRIAQTETKRAANLKIAKEYLEDEGVKFVKFTMSTKHPKVDICDFYANLDLGYGKGIVPKEEMSSLPLHPFCKCRYRRAADLNVKKSKRKSWEEAVRDTMNEFSEYEQKEIVGSREKLAQFKAGKDIEQIFNEIRSPKYRIRKYVDIFRSVKYNSYMQNYEEAILKKFENFDVGSKEKAIESFKKLWNSERSYKNHLAKRLKMGHIKDEFDYVNKTLKCLEEAKDVTIAKYNNSDSWDRIRYFDNKEWIVIFSESGTLLTSHKKEQTEINFEQKHKSFGARIIKGEVNEKFREIFKGLRAKLRIL